MRSCTKSGIILRLVSLQKLCTVVSLRPHRRTGKVGGTTYGGARLGRVEQKCCRTLNTTILYDHPVQRSPTHHRYLPSDTDSRLSWIEAKQTETEGERKRTKDGRRGTHE